MEGISFTISKKEKDKLNLLAHELSIKKGKKVSTASLIRKAVKKVYFRKKVKDERS